jgi:hypothetical protein
MAQRNNSRHRYYATVEYETFAAMHNTMRHAYDLEEYHLPAHHGHPSRCDMDIRMLLDGLSSTNLCNYEYDG